MPTHKRVGLAKFADSAGSTNHMIIVQPSRRQRGHPGFFESRVKQRVKGHSALVKSARAPFSLLALVLLVAASVACAQAVLEKRLVGTWAGRNGVVKFAQGGTLESRFTNRADVWVFEGSWILRSNVLVLTTTTSNGVAYSNVADCKVIRLNNSRLIYSINGQTMTFIRKY